MSVHPNRELAQRITDAVLEPMLAAFVNPVDGYPRYDLKDIDQVSRLIAHLNVMGEPVHFASGNEQKIAEAIRGIADS